MIALRDWFPYVSPLCNGALVPAIEDAVLDASIEWCQRTECDMRTIAGLDVTANVPDIELPKPEVYVTPHRARTVYTSCDPLQTRTRQELECEYPKGFPLATTDGLTKLKYWLSRRPGFITLIPYSTQTLTAALTVECSMQPTRNAIEVADFLFEFWAEQIGWGAAARIHETPNAPYALPDRAAFYRNKFDAAVMTVLHSPDVGFQKPRLHGATVR